MPDLVGQVRKANSSAGDLRCRAPQAALGRRVDRLIVAVGPSAFLVLYAVALVPSGEVAPVGIEKQMRTVGASCGLVIFLTFLQPLARSALPFGVVKVVDRPRMTEKKPPMGVRVKSLTRGSLLQDGETIVWELAVSDCLEKCDSSSTDEESVTSGESLTSIESDDEFVPAFAALASLYQDSVLYGEDGDSVDDIQDLSVEALLKACWQFEAEMRQYGNMAAAHDFRQNIRKVEAVYDKASPNQRHTVARLLAFEQSIGGDRHKRNGRLKEHSAAMGLVWIYRNLAAQHQTYSNAFIAGLEPLEASLLAFKSIIEPHLPNVLVRKLASLYITHSVVRDRRHFLAKLSGYNPSTFALKEEAKAMEALRSFLHTLQPILEQWERILMDHDVLRLGE